MKRFLFLVAAVLSGLGGVHAQQVDAVPNKWRLVCDADTMTDRRTCSVDMVLSSEGRYAPALLILAARRGASGPIITLSTPDDLCPRLPSMLRVDRNTAQEFEWFRGMGIIPSERAAGLVDELIKGTDLRLRAYFWPGCERKEFELLLDGFAESWRRLQTGDLPVERRNQPPPRGGLD